MKGLQFTKENEFVPLKEMLLENNEKIKEIKSLYQREVEYVSFLGPIESFFAYFYLDNTDTKDSDIEKAIKNVKMNYYKNINDFSNYFEKELIGVISQVLRTNIKVKKRRITQHELFLVLNYILWSIDNRKHIGDKQAYLKWICNFFHLLNEDEKEEFDEFYDDYGKKKGISKEQIKLMKNEESSYGVPVEDILSSKIESEEYSEEDDKGEYQLWDEGGFIESVSPLELPKKLKTINKGHDEDMNFNCKRCNKKISAHNKDWHEGMCDECFNKTYHPNINK